MAVAEGVALQEHLDTLVRRRQEQLVLPWLGTMTAVGVCAILVALLSADEPTELKPAVSYGLLFVGALLAVAAVWVPRRLLADATLTEQLQRAQAPLALSQSLKLGHDDEQLLLTLPEPELRLLSLTLLVRPSYFAALAISESVAAVGLVAGLLADSALASAPYFAVALILHGLHFPRLQSLILRGRRLLKTDDSLDEVSDTISHIEAEAAAAMRRVKRPSRSTDAGAPRRTHEPTTRKKP